MLNELLRNSNGINFIKKIKFEKISFDTLFEEPTNFIEQINQTSTYFVCLSAVALLLSKFPHQSFSVNFGVEPGYDIVSEDNTIICECFAATAPNSNNKLKKDVEKLYKNKDATHKYVIFYAFTSMPTYVNNLKNKYFEVEIISLA